MMPTLLIYNFDFSPASAGARLFHYLPALLAAADIPVVVNKLCYYNPLIPVRSHALPGEIAVYPDITRGNPAGAGRVARYFGFFPDGFFGGDKIQADECALCFDFGDHQLLKEVREACLHEVADEDEIVIPSIDPAWLFPEKKTIKNLLYTGYPSKPRLRPRPNIEAVEIPSRETPQEQNGGCFCHYMANKRTSALLRRADNVYTIDHYTMLIYEAALCGCNVLKVHGENDFEEVWRESVCNAQAHCMNPRTDTEVALCFARQIYKFFGECA